MGTVPRGGHYPGRKTPSRFIFHRNVERFIPNRAAAPMGRPRTQPVSRRRPQDVLALGLGQRDRLRRSQGTGVRSSVKRPLMLGPAPTPDS